MTNDIFLIALWYQTRMTKAGKNGLGPLAAQAKRS
jgi:hypothetical protein